MNIQNFTPFEPSWDEIFQMQRELKFMYEPEAKELFENFDIDCFEDQELFKKYCWRVTEELTEALEAFFIDGEEHTKEELIDAMNFSIELMLLYGWRADHLQPGKLYSIYFGPSPVDKISSEIYLLGLTANCLKNRQWRKSQYLVDLLVFENRFTDFITSGYSLLIDIFGSDEEIRKAWSLKYQVNLFRIQTNY